MKTKLLLILARDDDVNSLLYNIPFDVLDKIVKEYRKMKVVLLAQDWWSTHSKYYSPGECLTWN